MLYFIFGSVLVLFSFYLAFSDLKQISLKVYHFMLSITHAQFDNQKNLKELQEKVVEIRALLEVGRSPSLELIHSLSTLEWGNYICEVLLRIRENGGALVPVLVRFQEFLQFIEVTKEQARVKSSPAFAQAIVLLLLVPVCSFVLYILIPELALFWKEWLFVSLIAFMWSLVGVIWVLSLIEDARWIGLKGASRFEPFIFLITVEWTLAMIRTGVSADMAWKLKHRSIDSINGKNTKILKRLGLFEQIKRIENSIYLSMIEGRSCSERLINVSEEFKKHFQMSIYRMLELLPSQILKPLFLCLAPSIFILIISIVWILISETGFFAEDF